MLCFSLTLLPAICTKQSLLLVSSVEKGVSIMNGAHQNAFIWIRGMAAAASQCVVLIEPGSSWLQVQTPNPMQRPIMVL
jgi:hypothetical protein